MVQSIRRLRRARAGRGGDAAVFPVHDALVAAAAVRHLGGGGGRRHPRVRWRRGRRGDSRPQSRLGVRTWLGGAVGVRVGGPGGVTSLDEP